MFKTRFVAGLIIWLPVGGTVLIINFLLGFFDKIWNFVPAAFHPQQYLGFAVPGLSVILSLVIIYVTGALVSNFIGKNLVNLSERILGKIPGVRSFYRGIKQMTEAVFLSGTKSFQSVFLIEYPKKGLWTIAFETSDLQGEAHRLIKTQTNSKERLINLFVPTTPNPTSGYFIMANEVDLIRLEMSVDDALKMIVSGGVFVPTEAKPIKTIKENPLN